MKIAQTSPRRPAARRAEVPSVASWRQLLAFLRPAFRPTASLLLAHFLTAWVLCVGRHCVSRIWQFIPPEVRPSRDAVYRLLRDGHWQPEHLWRRLARWVVAVFVRDHVLRLNLDDTLHRRTGRKVEGAGWFRDPLRSLTDKPVFAWGLNLVVLALVVQIPQTRKKISLPIYVCLHHKTGPSVLELAARMIHRVAEWFPAYKLDVCADGFYAPLVGHPLWTACSRVRLTSRMRRDARLHDRPPPRSPGRRGRPPRYGPRLPTPAEWAREVKPGTGQRVWLRLTGRKVVRELYSRVVLWPKACGSRPLLLVLVRDPRGHEPDEFLFTTATDLSPVHVLLRYHDRASLEETFRDEKQVLGSQELQSWARSGPERTATLAFALYTLVWGWYLRVYWPKLRAGCGTRGVSPRCPVPRSRTRRRSERPAIPVLARATFCRWYPGKEAPSFADALAVLRRTLWAERISLTFKRASDVPKILEDLVEVCATAA